MRLFFTVKRILVVPFILVTLNSAPAWGQSPTEPASAKKDAKQGDNTAKAPDSTDVRREDWNSLAIPSTATVSNLVPPLKAQREGFTREFVQLEWRPGDLVDLYIMKPTGVEKPPVILYLYSFPSNTDRFKDDAFGTVATKNGFAAVGFISALTGDRFRDRPMREWFISDLQEALASSVHDVQFILKYLAQRGDLDMNRVGMFGDGSGASIAIMTAAVDPTIRVLDLFNAWGDWPDWLAHSTLVPDNERSNYLKPEFLKTMENLDPMKWLPQLKTEQVRLQYLKDNTVTPAAARERMKAALPPNGKLIEYDSGRIFLKDVAYPGKTFDWVKEQLEPNLLSHATEGQAKQASSATKSSER